MRTATASASELARPRPGPACSSCNLAMVRNHSAVMMTSVGNFDKRSRHRWGDRCVVTAVGRLCDDPRTKGSSRIDVVAVRPLGTMIIYGFPERELDAELDIALGIGATVLEILPDWSRFPDPELVRMRVGRSGTRHPQCARLLGRADHSCDTRRPRIDRSLRSPANRSTT